jgi:hypothetical protein
MMKFVLLSAVLMVASFNGAAAESRLDQQHHQADSTDPFLSPTDRATLMVAEIADWIVANFELPPPRSAPAVAFASQVELMRLRTQDRAQWQGFKYDDDPASQRNVVAVYDTATSTIYLPPNWTGITPADQSVLVHEMVHHLQNMAKLKHECPEAREKVAYLAQDAWLKRTGLSLEAEFGVDMFTIIASSACMYSCATPHARLAVHNPADRLCY